MKRSPGVTLIAILSLIGSAFTFAIGIVILAVVALAPTSPSNPFSGSPVVFRVILALAAFVYLLPAVWGILTGIGLWRLKNWARISMIVFAVLLSVMGGFTGLASFAVPFPAAANGGLDPSAMTTVRIAMGAFWLLLLAIGIWWLVFFNRPKVKAQFAHSAPASSDAATPESAHSWQNNASAAPAPEVAQRPLSITILAWLLLAGCLFIPLGLILHSPAILFTKMLTGWPATAVFFIFAILQLFIGIGLLRLRPFARIAAIAYFVFGAVNTAVFNFAPGGHERALALMENQVSMFPWTRPFESQPQLLLDPGRLIAFGAVTGVIAATIPLYFLITRKLAYEKAAEVRSIP